MRRLPTLAIALCSLAHAAPPEVDRRIDAALVAAADVGSGAKATYSDAGEFVLGVVLSESRGRLVILRRQAAGRYAIDSESHVFENDFGPGYDIEMVEHNGPRRFSIQVNSRSGCGTQVETFRLAQAGGAWRVAGYDKSEPDAPPTCDVNSRSRELSADLLTGQVHVVDYRAGKPVRHVSRVTRAPAPEVAAFDFSMFDIEP